MGTRNTQISVLSSAKAYVVSEQKIADLTTRLMNAVGLKNHEVSIQFVGSTTMRKLNKKFRGKDKSTDVLSFPQKNFGQPLMTRSTRTIKTSIASVVPQPLGDIVISLSDAKKNAKKIGQALDRETAFLLVHGFLHLCGHDHMHPKEEEIMLSQQKILMQQISKTSKTQRSPVWRSCVRKLRGS